MNEGKKTIAAMTLIIIVIALIGVSIAVFAIRKKPVLSPVPEESGIRVIFVSPTAAPAPSQSQISASPTPKPKATATPRPTASPAPTKSATGSAAKP